MKQDRRGLTRHALWWAALTALAVTVVAGKRPSTSCRQFCMSADAPTSEIAPDRLTDIDGTPAWKPFWRDAAKALDAGPFSVMQKTKIPPSGDKHDYYSLAPYAWPDPNRKDGLPYLQRDGRVNPESKVGTDSKTFDRMAWTVRTLALAYRITNDDRYARHAAMLLRAWFLDPATRMNPHLNYAQAIPGRNEGRATGIIESHVLVALIDAVDLLEPSSEWTSDDRQGMTAWCRAYLDWLLTSDFGRKEAGAENNHGTWHDAQAVSLALYVGQERLARTLLEECRHRRIDAQIEPDGRQPRELARTRSFHYSLFNLHALFSLASMGDRVGVDLWRYQSDDGRGLRKALDYVAPYADPQKAWPHAERNLDRSALLPFLQQAVVVFGPQPYRQLLRHFSADAIAANRTRLLYGIYVSYALPSDRRRIP